MKLVNYFCFDPNEAPRIPQDARLVLSPRIKDIHVYTSEYDERGELHTYIVDTHFKLKLYIWASKNEAEQIMAVRSGSNKHSLLGRFITDICDGLPEIIVFDIDAANNDHGIMDKFYYYFGGQYVHWTTFTKIPLFYTPSNVMIKWRLVKKLLYDRRNNLKYVCKQLKKLGLKRMSHDLADYKRTYFIPDSNASIICQGGTEYFRTFV